MCSLCSRGQIKLVSLTRIKSRAFKIYVFLPAAARWCPRAQSVLSATFIYSIMQCVVSPSAPNARARERPMKITFTKKNEYIDGWGSTLIFSSC